jgi:formylglycine-generating enzyme required for sulfatase activity/tRNA A-37 threonylcarbamoyl transferase component Bud32
MLSSTEFLDALRRFALLEPAKLEDVTLHLLPQYPSASTLGEQLIAQGALTSYQVESLLDDRGQELLLGPYIVLDCLGKGGMGAVYKARHTELDRVAAVKVIRGDYLGSAGATERFKREARAAARLRHPNVVLVYDAGEVGGVRFLAMEYLEGTDLWRLVNPEKPLPIASACEYVRQAALGLQHIHECGLVHRDIKPSNLLLQKGGPREKEADRLVKVLDLGLVRFEPTADGAGPVTLTESHVAMGTPDFLAPEQIIDAHNVDGRADLYSLGCTFYYLLTVRLPFPGGIPAQKLVRQQMDEAAAIEQLRPEVPPSVAAVVRKLMAKKPADRYQTAGEVADVLARIAQGPAAVPSRRAPEGSATRTVVPKGRRRQLAYRWLLVLGIVFVAIACYLSFVAMGPSSTGPGSVARHATEPQAPTPASVGGNRFGMDFVWIGPGAFAMGSPEEENAHRLDEVLHRVTLTRGFWMQDKLVTQEQWKAVMGAEHPCKFKGDDLPVDSVSWHDAKEFCTKLNQIEHNAEGYRLPYEAEWEYAARAGTKTPFWQGETVTTEQVNFDGTYPYRKQDPKGENRGKTTVVGKFAANPWKLRDMGGNLEQWCEDRYGDYPKGDLEDPRGPEKGTERVLRSGAWGYYAGGCRAACRGHRDPSNRDELVGFRVVLPAGAPRRE